MKKKKEKEISVAQAAEIAEVTPATIYNWVQLGKLEGISRRHFSKIKIKYQPFLEWVVENTK